MKKALSILLSVMMVAGLFIALIPTASAANVAAENPELDLTNPVYFNDFEDTDEITYSDKEGDELLAALGWYLSPNWDVDVDGYSDGRYDYADLVKDGQVIKADNGGIILSHDGSSSLGSSGDGAWESLTFAADSRLAGGDYTIEFDIAFLSTDVASEVEDGAEFRSAATGSGASCGPMGTGMRSVADKLNTYWHYGIKSRGERDIHVSIPTQAGVSGWGGTQTNYDGFATGAGSMYTVTESAGMMMKFRIVVDSEYGISAWVSDDDGYSWTYKDGMTADQVATWQTNAQYISKEVKWRATGGMDARIDNLGIYVHADKEIAPSTPGESVHIVTTETPELVISEVATQATATDNQKLHTLMDPAYTEGTAALAGKKLAATDANGNYLVPVDGVNSISDTTSETTRFEYLEIYNSGDKTVDLSDYSISYWAGSSAAGNGFSSGGLVAFSRIHKGLKVVTDSADGLQWQFYNAPEDCILKPGEAAILFMPNNWFFGTPTTGHVNAFKQYVLMGEYGMTEEQVKNTKVLTLYDNLDELKAMCPGYNSASHFANGMGINNSGRSIFAVVRDNADGSVPYAFTEKVCLVETVLDNLVSYVADDQAGDRSVWIWGTERTAATARAAYSRKGGYASHYTYWDAEGNFVPGGKLDSGSLLPSTAAAITGKRTVGYVPEHLMNPAQKSTAAPANEAQWIGFQTTVAEGGKYDLRLVASIADMTDVSGIGFAISVNGGAEKVVYLEYYYEQITTDYGTGSFVAPENGYVAALEITGCPEATNFTVKVVTVYNNTPVVTSAYSVTYGANA